MKGVLGNLFLSPVRRSPSHWFCGSGIIQGGMVLGERVAGAGVPKLQQDHSCLGAYSNMILGLSMQGFSFRRTMEGLWVHVSLAFATWIQREGEKWNKNEEMRVKDWKGSLCSALCSEFNDCCCRVLWTGQVGNISFGALLNWRLKNPDCF